MAIDKRSENSYRVRRSHGGKVFHHNVVGTEEEAEEIDMVMGLSLKRHGVWPPPEDSQLQAFISPKHLKSGNGSKKATLREALERARKGHWTGTANGPQAIKRAELIVDIFEELEKPALEDIGEEEVSQLIKALKKRGLAAATVNSYLAALSVVYGYARRKPELSKYRPDIARVPNRKKRNRTVTDAEELSLIEYNTKRGRLEFLDMCLLCIDTGLRRGEALKLRCRDGIDLDWPMETDEAAGELIVHAHVAVGSETDEENDGAKTEASNGVVALTERARLLLKKRIDDITAAAGRYNPEAKVFPNMNPDKVGDYWDDYRDSLGLMEDPGFTFHCTRHTTVTRAIDSGMDISKVKDFARHESIETTYKYLKQSVTRTSGVAAALSKRRPTHRSRQYTAPQPEPAAE